jgi:hypothetical protein
VNSGMVVLLYTLIMREDVQAKSKEVWCPVVFSVFILADGRTVLSIRWK